MQTMDSENLISAEIIADTYCEFTDERVTTMEVTMHRFVLAEFNTHRVFSRNSASSRAIPVSKQLDKVVNSPAWPITWPSEKPGMQGGTELEGVNLSEAQELFENIHSHTTKLVDSYLVNHPDAGDRLHKSLLNRLLEPFMWHKVIVTSTEWQNFFRQRSSTYTKLAQPEIMVAADEMLIALETSDPFIIDSSIMESSNLTPDKWHLPYVDPNARKFASKVWDETGLPDIYTLAAISAGRCCRVSYLTHGGDNDPADDVRLYNDLMSASPRHYSSLEHPCLASRYSEVPAGNLSGFVQLRHSHNISGITFEAFGGMKNDGENEATS